MKVPAPKNKTDMSARRGRKSEKEVEEEVVHEGKLEVEEVNIK